MSKEIKISHLAERIRTHKRLYYSGKPSISDEEYDRLEEELKSLEQNHPVLSLIGTDEIDPQNKVAHSVPMLSLDKTYDFSDIIKWKGQNDLVGTYKIDGNSCSLIYENGLLKMAKTRGDGRFGENVTNKIKWIQSIPARIDCGVDIEVRGEILCYTKQFHKLAEEMESCGLARPASERNIVAGILGRKDNIYLSSFLDFFAYEIIGIDFDLEEDCLKYLIALGFVTPEHVLIKTEEELAGFLTRTRSFFDDGDYRIDGAVFSFNDLKLRGELGSTSHHPRYKISFKWRGEVASSRIESINWSLSRRGILTPIAQIEQVELSGAKIKNVTLHNAAVVKTYKLKAGDIIEIIRAGEVIPKFLRVIESNKPEAEADLGRAPGRTQIILSKNGYIGDSESNERKRSTQSGRAPSRSQIIFAKNEYIGDSKSNKGEFTLPDKCPSCNSELNYDGIRLLCPNRSNCPAQNFYAILHWINAVDIRDLSEKRLLDMITKGIVKTIPDLYKLSLDNLLELDFTKKKMAEKLLKNIEKTKRLHIATFLNGIGLIGAGLSTLEKIAKRFKNLDEILNLSYEDLAKIDGFAQKSSKMLIDDLKEKIPLISGLKAVGIEILKGQAGRDGILSGLTFVITGELSMSRKEAEILIKKYGGKIASSVSKKTDYLLTNDLDSASSKFIKAKELNIKNMTERELLDHCRSSLVKERRSSLVARRS